MPSPGLRNRINRVSKALDRLKWLSKLNYEDFISDFRNIDSAERNLHIAIEGLLDIGSFIISELNLGAPKSYKDIGMILLKNKIVSLDIGNLMKDLARFRNVIVHCYAELLEDKIYDLLRNNISDLISVYEALLNAIKDRKIDP
ncbi:MAG: DUF86 domain-containing protein [Candidatus Asgardarchaeum sp.]